MGPQEKRPYLLEAVRIMLREKRYQLRNRAERHSRQRTVNASNTERQSKFHIKKNASGRVSCRCSTSTKGSSSSAESSSSSGGGPPADTEPSSNESCCGFHVAPEGISTETAWRPSAKAASASAAASAIALARSNLNCLRSALRFSLSSSDVRSEYGVRLCVRSGLRRVSLTFARRVTSVDLSRVPRRFASRQITLAEESSPPQDHRIFLVCDPDRLGRCVIDSFAVRILEGYARYAEEPQDPVRREVAC